MPDDPNQPSEPGAGGNEPGDWRAPQDPTAPMLDVDGRLVNRLAPLPQVEPRRPDEEPPLELAERTRSHFDPTPDRYRDDPPPPPRRRAPVVFGVLAAVAVALLAGLLLAPRAVRALLPVRQLERLVPRAHGTLLITSEPPGASVRIGDQLVGQTPFASDNLWGDGPLTLELKGYRLWKGTIGGGADVTIQATLSR